MEHDPHAIVDMARIEIEKKYNPDAEDQYIQTLKAAHIDEDNYFAHMVHDDMDAIAKDIRSAHTKDFDTAPETSVADTIREGIEEAANFKGSAKETQLFLLCHQLGLDYKSLSPEEFTVLMKALNRSKKLKSGINQRGRKGKRR